MEYDRGDFETPSEPAYAALTVRGDVRLEEIAARLIRENPALNEPVVAKKKRGRGENASRE